MDPKGYYSKFSVFRQDTGERVLDPTFTLIPHHDVHAAVALVAYAASCEADNPGLAEDLRRLAADSQGVVFQDLRALLARYA